MSRVTPPVNKALSTFSRRQLSTSTRSAPLSAMTHRAQEQRLECSKSEPIDHTTTRAHTTFSKHRPTTTTTQTQTFQPRPLMQGFRTSAPKPAALDQSTIDFMFFPSLTVLPEESLFSTTAIRMPLSPDNYAPNRSTGSGLEAETLDGMAPEGIVAVVAARPEQVVSALTAVVGNDGLATMDSMNVSFLPQEREEVREQGMISRIWSGLVDDVFGAAKMPKVV